VTLWGHLVNRAPLVYIDPSGHFAWLAVGLVGGLFGGAIYGYGSQVANNLNQGMSLGDALTTNIDPGQVALYAGTGAVIGTGVGALGGLAAGVITGAASGQTVATASTVTTVACSDGDCTNEISTLTQADLPAVQQFVQEAIDINNARGMVSSGPTWKWLSRTMLSASNQARMFMARAGERITGMMQVKYTSEGYTIQQLEGLGSGAGTKLKPK